MSIIDDLNWRYAVKKFDTKTLPDEKVATVLEAFRLGASSLGLQPWKLIVIKNPEIRAQLVEHSHGQEQVRDASHLLLLARKSTYTLEEVDSYISFIQSERNVPAEKLEGYAHLIKHHVMSRTEEQKADWLSKQLYIALGHLLAVCAVEKIDSCPMEGFDPQAWDEILGLKEKGLASVLALPIGYRSADDYYQNLKKVRYPMDQVVMEI